jgi:predicted transcriptional regulator
MAEIKLHVQNLEDFFADARRMARRLDAGDRIVEETHISFESMEVLLKALTPNRWRMLRRLRMLGPSSIRALSQALGRDYRGVHSDVGSLIELGLIERMESGKIFVPWSHITAEISLEEAA